MPRVTTIWCGPVTPREPQRRASGDEGGEQDGSSCTTMTGISSQTRPSFNTSRRTMTSPATHAEPLLIGVTSVPLKLGGPGVFAHGWTEFALVGSAILLVGAYPEVRATFTGRGRDLLGDFLDS